MDIAKKHPALKIISILLVVLFINLEISWAYPAGLSSNYKFTLSAQGMFQQQIIDEQVRRLQKSLFSDINLLTSVFSIGQYLLGDPEEKVKPLPLAHLESVMRNELGATLAGIEISNVRSEDGVVFIPYTKGDKKYIIQIALKNNFSGKQMAGYEWIVSEKYAVKILGKGYKEPAITQAKSKKEAQVTISEPIAQVKIDDIKAKVKTVAPTPKPKRTISIRAIVKTIILLLALTFFIPLGSRQSVLADEEARPPILGAQDEKTEELIRRLKDADWRVRRAAADALGEIKDTRAVDPLSKALYDKDVEVCVSAIKALGEIKDPRAVKPLIQRLLPTAITTMYTNEDDWVRESATEALIKINDTSAIELLIEVLGDGKYYNFRANAAYALGEIGDKKAIPALIRALEDRNADVRQSAQKALTKIGWEPFTKRFGKHIGIGIGILVLLGGYIVVLRKIQRKKKSSQRKLKGHPTPPKKTRRGKKGTDSTPMMMFLPLTGFLGIEGWPSVLQDNPALYLLGGLILIIGCICAIYTVGGLGDDGSDKESLAKSHPQEQDIAGNIPESPETETSEAPAIDTVAPLFELPEDIRLVAAGIRGNLDVLMTDSIIATLITLARSAKRENQKLIIGLETDWIPGYREGSMQHNALNPLVSEIRSLGDTLRNMGLDNVTVIHDEKAKLAAGLLKEAKDTSTSLSNVVVLASGKTISSPEFTPLRSTATERRAFLAGIDSEELINFYQRNQEDPDRQLYAQIMEMLLVTLELASGKSVRDSSIIYEYDKEKRTVTFLPEAEPKKYNELREFYSAQKRALQSSA